MRFVDLLKENSQWQSDYGAFSRYCLDRGDVRYYTSEGGSYLRDKNPANNDFPIYSDNARTLYAWVMLRCPQYEEVYHVLADEYRAMKGHRNFEDVRKPVEPEKKQIDYKALRRASGKKFIRGNDKGRLEEILSDGIQETDTERQSPNPSGLAKNWPSDIEKHRQNMLAQFRKENPDLHGPERERQRMIFMRKHFYTPMKPPKIFTEVGIAVNEIVQNAIRHGENPKDVLLELIRYAAEND